MFKPGKSGNPKGRPAGTPNKNTVEVKAALEQAFNGIGGVKALQDWANANKDLFYPLWIKLLPKDVNIGGQGGGELIIKVTNYGTKHPG